MRTPRPDTVPTVDLAEELWTWAHVARYTHRSRSVTYTLLAEPGFPAPLDLGGSGSDRLWVAAEVKAYLLTRRAVPRLSATPTPIDAAAPLQVRPRGRRTSGTAR